MVQVENKAKHFSSVNHITKTIGHHHYYQILLAVLFLESLEKPFLLRMILQKFFY